MIVASVADHAHRKKRICSFVLNLPSSLPSSCSLSSFRLFYHLILIIVDCCVASNLGSRPPLLGLALALATQPTYVSSLRRVPFVGPCHDFGQRFAPLEGCIFEDDVSVACFWLRRSRGIEEAPGMKRETQRGWPQDEPERVRRKKEDEPE